MNELDPTIHWAFPPSYFKQREDIEMNEQNTKVLNPETQLYSDLISIIKALDLFFLGNKLIKAVEQIYRLEPKDRGYTNERCALLCEQLANAQLHYGQGMITKENLIVDIEQTIYWYRNSKIEDHRQTNLICPRGSK